MTIKQQGGIFGRNPEFNSVTAATADINGGNIDGVILSASNEVKAHSLATISSTSVGSNGSNYWKVGTWSGVSNNSRLVLKFFGAKGFSNGTQANGETTVYLNKDNSTAGGSSDIEGSFYSITGGADPVVKSVYWYYVSAGVYDIYILPCGNSTYIDPVGYTNAGHWVTDVSNTGSTSVPAGAYNITSETIEMFVGATGDANASTPIGFNKDGNIVLASGSGIDFSATSGTGTSELFDDYEEGTWTPVPQDSSGNSGSAGSAVGTYTKIGNVVHATVYLDSINTTGLTAGQDFRIYGLPFSAASLPQAQIFTGDARMNDVTFSGNPNLAILDATDYIRIAETNSGAASDFVIVSEVASGTADIYGSITYMAA